jgi:DNA-binding transcriptional MerR regulator
MLLYLKSAYFYRTMLISQLSKLTGFPKDTIRYYEKIGLIELAGQTRRGANNYRHYPEETVRLLHSIRNLKELGFTLEEIREILVRKQIGALDNATSHKIIEQKIIHLDSQIDKLLLYKHHLSLALRQMDGEKINHLIEITQMRLAA